MEKFKSRKFLAMLFGAIARVVLPIAGIPTEAADAVISVAMAYIAGESLVDAVAAWKRGQ